MAVTAKSRGVERGCHVPMIVWAVGVKERGPTDEICDLSDILPTLVEYAGAALPPGYEVDGRSLVPFLRGESDAHRDWIFSYIGGTRLVRSRTRLLEVVCPILGGPRAASTSAARAATGVATAGPRAIPCTRKSAGSSTPSSIATRASRPTTRSSPRRRSRRRSRRRCRSFRARRPPPCAARR